MQLITCKRSHTWRFLLLLAIIVSLAIARLIHSTTLLGDRHWALVGTDRRSLSSTSSPVLLILIFSKHSIHLKPANALLNCSQPIKTPKSTHISLETTIQRGCIELRQHGHGGSSSGFNGFTWSMPAQPIFRCWVHRLLLVPIAGRVLRFLRQTNKRHKAIDPHDYYSNCLIESCHQREEGRHLSEDASFEGYCHL